LANEYGGEDNVTVIVIRIVAGTHRIHGAPARATKPGGK